jgi:hypothetical protein
VFSTDVVVTSSVHASPQRVIKVMFQESSILEDVEVINLPEDVVNEVKSDLENMRNQMIEKPTMAEWSIGYLPIIR